MKKKSFAKLSAIFMAAIMSLSIFAGTKGTPDTVYAAESGTPDTEYWTEVNTFTKRYEIGDKIAKIKFGDKRQWVVCGVDKSDDALVLLSISAFEKTKYGATSEYSKSNFVNKIDTYLADNFSAEEQEKMNEVTVTTDEPVKVNSEYVNQDVQVAGKKLYLPNVNSASTPINQYSGFFVGAKNDISIGLYAIKESGLLEMDYIWMRSPSGNSINSVYVVAPDAARVESGLANGWNCSVVPAFNLNLSSAIFASAADAASDSWSGVKTNADMEAGTYTLRYAPMDSSWDNVSAVISSNGTKVTVTGASGKYLMVQNNKGVYAKNITSDNEEVDAADISIDGTQIRNFGVCKVWVESTDAGRITTAKLASQEVAAVTYTVTVNYGTGSGDYAEGDNVEITADTAPNGKYFKEWEVISGEITLDSATDTTTSFEMPASDVEVTAVYEYDAPSIVSQPKDVWVYLGDSAEFSVTATGSELKYQWQVDSGRGNGFVNIDGAEDSVYTIDMVYPEYDRYKFRCVVSNPGGTVISNETVLNAMLPYVPVPDFVITATAGQHGKISPSGDVYVYYWNDQTFEITPDEGYEIDTLKVDGKEVDIVTSYTFEEVEDNHTIEVTFKQTSPKPPVEELPTILTQPQSVSVKAGEQAVFTLAASGSSVHLQWQVDKNDGNGFVDIAGADTTGYKIDVTDVTYNGYKYRCVLSNSAGTVTTDIATLTVTENVTPIDYEILDGANSSWTQNTDGSLVIRGNGEIAKFVSVKVDGKVVDADNYTVTEGSTIITLKPEYLKALSKGSHTFEIIWTDGSASTSFTVAENKPSEPSETEPSETQPSEPSSTEPSSTENDAPAITAPQTGYSFSPAPFITLFVVVLAGTVVMTVRRKKSCK